MTGTATGPLRLGLQIESTGLGGDPRIFGDLARRAEEAGWDGIFLSDPGYPTAGSAGAREICDMWLALAAIAQATERIRFGTLITPLPRYHPYEVALRSTSLDHLSDGRLELTVGAGHGKAFEKLGLDLSGRVSRFREALEIITRLWTQDTVTFEGRHYTLSDIGLTPRPIQAPIPLRVCAWNRTTSVDVATRYGGLHWPHYHAGESCDERGCFDRIASIRDRIGPEASFSIEGIHGSPDAPPELVRMFEDAGVTWWFETAFSYQLPESDPDGLRSRIERGPPR
ncbi:MAG: LLM class flavin-dependent oxidoreductase [Actinomycetota bacterium]